MKTKRFLLIALLALGCVGCQLVLVQQPVGVPVREDLSKTFDGIWQTLDGKYIFYVKSKPNGVLDVAGIESHDGRFIVRDTSCIVTRLGDWTFLNVPIVPDSAGRRFFLFAPFIQSSEGDLITAFMPSFKFFEEAIEKKELIGISKGKELKHIEIENPKQAFFESRISAMVRSSEAAILKRTRKGLVKDAWPMPK